VQCRTILWLSKVFFQTTKQFYIFIVHQNENFIEVGAFLRIYNEGLNMFLHLTSSEKWKREYLFIFRLGLSPALWRWTPFFRQHCGNIGTFRLSRKSICSMNKHVKEELFWPFCGHVWHFNCNISFISLIVFNNHHDWEALTRAIFS